MSWILLSSGKGPAECERAVFLMLTQLENALKKQGVSFSTVEAVAGSEPKTFKSVTLEIGQANAEVRQWLKSYEGTLQWICPSPFRPKHKRRNWFFSLSLLEPPTKQLFNENDVVFETFRASGPGGQHVNTTDSAVRAIHQPSGLSTVSSGERSQLMNRRVAVSRLAALISAENVAQRQAVEHSSWENHNQLERGNAVKTFRGAKFSAVK